MEEEFFHDIAFYTSQENRQSIGGFGKVFNSDKVNAPVVNTDSIGDFSNSAKLDLGVNSKAVLSLQNDPNDPALSFLTDEAVAIRCQSNIYLLSDSPIRVDDFNRGGSGSLTVNGACTVVGGNGGQVEVVSQRKDLYDVVIMASRNLPFSDVSS